MRTKTLIDNGCVYDGVNYSIKDQSITDANVKIVPDDVFNNFMEKVKDAHKKEQEEAEAQRLLKIAEDKRIKDLEAEVEKQRLENERIAEENKQKLAALEAKEEEIRLNELKAKVNKRVTDCTQLGLKYNEPKETYTLLDVNVTVANIQMLADAEWETMIGELTTAIPIKVKGYEAAQKKIADEAEAKRLQEIKDAQIEVMRSTRYNNLKSFGYLYPNDDLGTLPDKAYAKIEQEQRKVYMDKQTKLAIDKADKEKEQKKKEEERLAALASDKQKLLAFSDMLGKLVIPDVEQELAKAISVDIKTMIGKMQTHIHTKVKKLEE